MPGSINSSLAYEYKVAAFLTLKCVQEDMKDFMLAAKVDGYQAFNDLFIVTRTADGREEALLFEIMHNMKKVNVNDLLRTRNFFSLDKLYNRYERLYRTRDDKLTMLQNVKDVYYMLYTRAEFDRDINFLEYVYDGPSLGFGRKLKINYDKLLKTGYIVKNECIMKQFLDRFIIIDNQTPEDLIDFDIKQILMKFCNYNHDFTTVTGSFIKFFSDWQMREHYILTKRIIINKLVELLLGPYMCNLKFQTVSDYDDYLQTGYWQTILENKNLTFIEKDTVVETFVFSFICCKLNAVCNTYIFSHPSSSYATILDCTKDSIKSDSLYRELSLHNVPYFTLYEILLAAWRAKEVPLVLYAEKGEIQIILETIKILKCSLNFIILTNHDVLSYTFDRKINAIFSMEDLNEESKNILNKHEVSIQGKDKKMHEMSEILKINEISVKDIIYILIGRYHIGNVTIFPNYYVPQSLSQVIIKTEALKNCPKDVFIINCKDEKLLKEWDVKTNYKQYLDWNNTADFDINIILTQTDCFQHVLDSFPQRCVHELQYNESKNILELSRSKGGIHNLRNYLINSDISVDELTCNLTRKIYIIVGDCGMGKSLLTRIIFSRVPADMWVLYVDLSKQADYFDSEEFKDNLSEPSQHLNYFNRQYISSMSQNKRVTKIAFQYFMSCSRMLIIFDGYDAIATEYEQEVTQMIKSLYNDNNSNKIIITTRPIMQRHLETNFDTISLSLNPFSMPQQVSFFNRYFTQEKKMWDADRPVNEFVEKLLGFLRININDRNNNFTSVPLHSKLIATLLYHCCIVYVKNCTIDFLVYINLLRLHEFIVTQKYEIAKEKHGRYMRTIRNMIKEYQQLFAVKSIFPNKLIVDLKIESKLTNFYQVIDNLKAILQQFGVIMINSEDEISFIHGSFADYFAATWLAENFDKPRYKSTVIKLLKTIFEPNYKAIRSMFDSIMAKNKLLHLALINGHNYKLINEIIEKDGSVLQQLDDGGRSVIHMLAAWGLSLGEINNENGDIQVEYKRTIELIINSGAFTGKDNILGYVPIDYACCTNSTLLNYFKIIPTKDIN